VHGHSTGVREASATQAKKEVHKLLILNSNKRRADLHLTTSHIVKYPW
jgi:hypothetical protein